LSILAFAVLLGVAAQALAQGPRVRRVGVRWRDGVPAVSVSARDLANGAVRRKLDSGLPQTIVVQLFAYDEDGVAVAVAPRTCRVVYDLWEEVYRVQIQTLEDDEAATVGEVDAVLDHCLVLRRQEVGSRADYRAVAGERIYFAALVELNPLSPDTVERIRRWLARPAGGRVESGAFFGSFVSLFVNRRIGEAERTVRFRSQTLRAPR
jgi:hypothetical protein